MEKIEIAVLPQSSRRHPKFAFPQKRPSGRTVLEAVGISKRYGDNQVLDGIDLQVDRGDRIAIIGPNCSTCSLARSCVDWTPVVSELKTNSPT